MIYPCIGCGICCTFLKGIPELAGFHGGDGVCVNLKNNRCEIYASRPDICSTEKMYRLVLSEDMSENEFIYSNLHVCLMLNREHGEIHNVRKLTEIIKEWRSKLS